VCPEGRRLRLTTARTAVGEKVRSGLIFCRPVGGCQSCSFRAGCLRSANPKASKHVEVGVALSVSERLQHRLSRVRRPDEDCVAIEEITAEPGPYQTQSSLFLPARARQHFRAAVSGGDLRMRWVGAPPRPPRPILLAEDVADRQRRRKTWADNLARYQLPPGATLQIEVAGAERFVQIFTGLDPTKKTLKSTG